METHQEERVLEVAIFKLNEGFARQQFLDTVGPVSSWVKTQPGFISRDLTFSAEDDRWVDVVWWRSLAAAHAAAEAAMSSEACAPMFGMIDIESMSMRHGESAIAPVTA